MSFTFHYCKKIPGRQVGLSPSPTPPVQSNRRGAASAFLESSPTSEMTRFPKSLIYLCRATFSVRNRVAFQRRIPKLPSPDRGFKSLTQDQRVSEPAGWKKKKISKC